MAPIVAETLDTTMTQLQKDGRTSTAWGNFAIAVLGLVIGGLGAWMTANVASTPGGSGTGMFGLGLVAVAIVFLFIVVERERGRRR